MHLPVSSHPHILMLVCTCLYPRILTSSYLLVHMPSLSSLHPHNLISSVSHVLACIFASLHPHILRFISVWIVSLHPHILRFICACLYTCTPTSSYPQASEHHHILRFKFTENKLFHVNFTETLRRFNKFLIVFKNSYNPGHNILELYNVLVPVRVATGKTKLDI